MTKQWIGIGIATALLAACTTNDNSTSLGQQPVQPVVCNGPSVEISGAEPRVESLNPNVNQDYERNGKNYKIVNNPANFSQVGLAAIYDGEPSSHLTASGEMFDATGITAAHPTLPIPSYARVTNLANGRMLVVRINDRGPYGNDRVISLSRAAADRLNTSNNTRVRIDPILVAADGSLSGPGTACTTIAKQTYALPPRPDLNGGMGVASSLPMTTTSNDAMPISNASLSSSSNLGAPVKSSGFLGAPTPLAAGVLEEPESVSSSETETTQPTVMTPVVAAPVTAAAKVNTQPVPKAAPSNTASKSGDKIVVQVGAVSDKTRADNLLAKLKKQFNVPGSVAYDGKIYRIQLGSFNNREQATQLQQRLMNETQQTSFVTRAAQ